MKFRCRTLFTRPSPPQRNTISHSVSVACNSSCAKSGRKREKLFNASADGHAVHGRRCLHGLCHGSQWPWLTSAMQDASSDVACARGPLNSLHSLVSSGGANGVVCFLRVHSSSWPCPRYSEQLAARSHRWYVRPAPQIFKGKPRASCGRTKKLQSVRLVEAPTRDGGV